MAVKFITISIGNQYAFKLLTHYILNWCFNVLIVIINIGHYLVIYVFLEFFALFAHCCSCVFWTTVIIA